MPQAQALTAATTAIIAQLDGDSETVTRLARAAAHVGDEVTTRQWQQWAAALRWWAGEAVEEPEVPGPLLRPYFLMLMADRERMPHVRALELLDEALVTIDATGERFCEAEVRRVRGMVLAQCGLIDEAGAALDEAVGVARSQGARMLELRALTGRASLPGAPLQIYNELQSCATDLAPNGETRSLHDAFAVLGSTRP